MPPKLAKVQGNRRKSQSFNKKRSFNYSTPLPLSKRPYLTSPTKYPIKQNHIHWHVITINYKKSLYKASSQTTILAALKSCIKGYKSLYIQASIIQYNILTGNLIINKENNNPS